MKSPEFGGIPAQSSNKPEKNKQGQRTTPEEATAITLQRRKEYGLGDRVDLTPEELNEIEACITKSLNDLGRHNYENLDLETQNEWYLVELEAMAGKDRELAKAVLEQFIDTLKNK